MKVFPGKHAQVLLDTIIAVAVLAVFVSAMVSFISWVSFDMNRRFSAYRSVFSHRISGRRLPSISFTYKGSSFYEFKRGQR